MLPPCTSISYPIETPTFLWKLNSHVRSSWYVSDQSQANVTNTSKDCFFSGIIFTATWWAGFLSKQDTWAIKQFQVEITRYRCFKRTHEHEQGVSYMMLHFWAAWRGETPNSVSVWTNYDNLWNLELRRLNQKLNLVPPKSLLCILKHKWMFHT